MTTKIQRWGNSLAVRIPFAMAKEISLQEGSVVSFSIEGKTLIVEPQKKPQYTLKELLKGAVKKKGSKEFDWGKPMGREIW